MSKVFFFAKWLLYLHFSPKFQAVKAALVINEFENTLSLSYNRTSGHGSHAHTQRRKGSRLCSLHLLGLQLYSPSAWWTQMRSHASSAAGSFPIQIEIQAEHDLALETDGEPHDVRWRWKKSKSAKIRSHGTTSSDVLLGPLQCWVHPKERAVESPSRRWQATTFLGTNLGKSHQRTLKTQRERGTWDLD